MNDTHTAGVTDSYSCLCVTHQFYLREQCIDSLVFLVIKEPLYTINRKLSLTNASAWNQYCTYVVAMYPAP